MSNLFAGWGKRLNNQSQIPTLRNFGLGLLALFMVIFGMGQARSGAWVDVAILVGGGLILWLWRLGKVDALRVPIIGATRLQVPRWWLGGMIAIVALGIAVWAWYRLDVDFPTDADWLWYLASIGLLLVAAAVLEQWDFRGGKLGAIGNGVWLLVAVVVLGAIVRLLFLDSLPFGTWYDEAANGLEALRVAREPGYRPIYTDGVNSTGHYLWLIVGAFRLFGENPFAVRSISVLMGIATIVAAYLAGRELHGRSFGLVLAVLVAVARWSITFSRLGMYNSATPLFELLALFWYLRGLRRGSVLDFTLAGISIGFGLCFYSAFQLFLVMLGILTLVVAWQERARWRTLVMGLVICAVAVLVVIAPVVKFVQAKPSQYFARVQATSLFADKAPEERLPALIENSRKHLLMFNVRGDPNGRHNLPGEPMVDWITGGMLVVGVAICLYRGLSPRFFILPLWILIGLLGGILSLDFEAPQSLRAIGALPAVFMCAALPPSQLVDEWRRGAGRYYPNFGFWIVGFALLIPAAFANLNTYFVRQANDFASWNAHSTPETIAARIMQSADPAMEKYVISLFDGHPTVRFLAHDLVYRRVETNAALPLLREMPNGMMLVLDAEREDLYAEARRLYPNATFQEIRPPNGGPVVIYVNQLTSQDLQSVQGLTAEYVSKTGAAPSQFRKEMVIDADWPGSAPIPLPFEAEWDGVLAVNTYGPYQFFVEAPGQVTLSIGGSVVIDGDASEVEGLGGGLMLARGHHAIRLRAEGGEGKVRLAWQPPDGPPSTIPSWALYVPPVQSQGLLGRYYANGEWGGEPSFAQIDPRLSMYFHVPTLPRPYTVEWSGKIAIPEAGEYAFGLQSVDESTLSIDGVELVASKQANEMDQAAIRLKPGLHDIVVRYADRTNHTYINLSWRPPVGDGSFRPIPSELLFPPQENYELVNVSDLSRFVQSNVPMPTFVSGEATAPANVEVMATGLVQPRGVAIHDGIVYVAESGNGRVLAFDAITGEHIASPFDSINFAEPFDLAVQVDGTMTVLDAGSGQLFRYDPTEGMITEIPVPSEQVNRSRGIGAGLLGESWIANTPGQRILAIDVNGAQLQEISLPAVASDNNEMQPVDVVVLADNTLFVTDVAKHMLYRFSLAGYLLSSQSIPASNALEGAHLATPMTSSGIVGSLYMTEPENGRVVKLDATGLIEQIWSVRTPETNDAKPVGIAVAADGVIWVADSQGGRLLRVTPESAE